MREIVSGGTASTIPIGRSGPCARSHALRSDVLDSPPALPLPGPARVPGRRGCSHDHRRVDVGSEYGIGGGPARMSGLVGGVGRIERLGRGPGSHGDTRVFPCCPVIQPRCNRRLSSDRLRALQRPSPRPELRHSCVGVASCTGRCPTVPDEDARNTLGGNAQRWCARQDSNLRPSD